jgi:hypothetical protein
MALITSSNTVSTSATSQTSALTFTPSNKNFLSPLNFTFVLKRSPYLNFFVQKINLPQVQLDFIDTPSPQLYIPTSASHVTFGNLDITFKVDEYLQNYMEVFNWLMAIGYPLSQTGYAALKGNQASTGESLVSDISVIISDGLKNPNYEVVFTNAFPLSLGEIEFQSTDTDIEYVTAVASFRYAYYTINKV